MRVVVAVDSFKGSISAADAGRALSAGLGPDAEVVLRPMADGGEGTLDAFAAIPGAERVPVTVTGPADTPVEAAWLRLPATDITPGTGVVELASTSGIELLGAVRRPWDADTRGFGQAIAAALNGGVSRLVLGIGSSASTDGGAGMLRALGARITDRRGGATAPGARGLAEVAAVDLTGMHARPPGGVVVLTDVNNPLIGCRGAAAVFGPQKGLSPAGVVTVDAGLARFAAALGVDPVVPGTGAAGGAGLALGAWGAQLVPGAARIAELVGLADAVRRADLVITGEGAYDAQSAAGKVPMFVAVLAARAGVPVALVAGRIAPDADLSHFAASVSLTDLAGGSAAALADPVRHLAAAGAVLASPL